ncbi:HNH endonuclease [Vibrio phage eugene 12A10]|uniref:HNH endonuclease n=2 Tax=unclassified Caudoviricetes TaxID=2788787 RepID=UPI00035197F5|nr:HNH endonuclease [Vibrio phage eugene 12A10]AGN51638.1 endonuclease [Vibrio phage eugene 12A10]
MSGEFVMLKIYEQVNDLTVEDIYRESGRSYYKLSCSYGHSYTVRCDALQLNRQCTECKKLNIRKKRKSTVCEGFIKGQLKVLEVLPKKPYTHGKVLTECMCGNVQEMFSCNVVKENQNFSCGNCKPYYRVEKDVVKLYTDNTLSNYFMIDFEDLEKVYSIGWMIHNDDRNFYVREGSGERRFLHRVLTNCPERMFVDHINGNGLDNRKINLRVVTKAENNRNTKLHCNNTSGKSGVYLRPETGKWRAKIGHDGKVISLGEFETKDAAILAREIAELQFNYHNNHGRNNKAGIGEDFE